MDYAFESRAVYEYKFSFIPRRCYNTKKLIFGLALRGRRIYTGPGDPVVEDRWFHRHEGILKLMKEV